MKILDQLYRSVLAGNAADAEDYAKEALRENIEVQDIISKGMNAAMEEVGILFSRNEIFLPEMMIAARAMKAGMAVLEPFITEGSGEYRGKLILGTVKDDLHDVGKNLVAMMFRGSGFQVVDLGIDVPKEMFLETALTEDAQLIGISALLTTVLPNVTETIDFLKNSGLPDRCRILIGGAPVNSAFADEAGADGYAPDAGAAVQLAKGLVGP